MSKRTATTRVHKTPVANRNAGRRNMLRCALLVLIFAIGFHIEKLEASSTALSMFRLVRESILGRDFKSVSAGARVPSEEVRNDFRQFVDFAAAGSTSVLVRGAFTATGRQELRNVMTKDQPLIAIAGLGALTAGYVSGLATDDSKTDAREQLKDQKTSAWVLDQKLTMLKIRNDLLDSLDYIKLVEAVDKDLWNLNPSPEMEAETARVESKLALIYHWNPEFRIIPYKGTR